MLFSTRHAADGKIVRRVLSGHHDDFGILVDRYLPVVQAVALARVRNRTEAEDVAQEAFVRAYEKLDTLRERGKFGPWISTITRNIALRTAQKRAREVPLEEEHLAPPPQGVRQREETLQLLRECVERLDEVPREMILLHYYAGKSLVEIAALLEISRDAVAKRLQRAREALSQEVVAEIEHLKPEPKQNDLRKKAIVAALGTVPAAWSASAAGTGAGAMAGGGLLATTGAKLVATAIGVAAVAALAWEAGLLGASEEISPPAALAPVLAAASVPAVTPPPSQMPEVPAAATAGAPPAEALEEHGPGRISGRVLDMQEQPIPGATVVVEHVTWRSDEEPPAETLRREATADGAGYVSIDDLPLGDYGILSYAGDLVDAISTSLSETSPVAEEDVVLKPGSPLGGVVLDPAGQPVEGATVLPYQFSVLGEEVLPHEPTAVIRQATNAEGAFRFPRLWPGKWKLFVLAEGYAPTVTDFIRHKTTDAVIRLSNSLQAHGTVIHADTGEPLAGVHFVARNKHCSRDAHEVVSGEGGAFTLEGLAAGEYQIDVNDPSMIAGRDPLVIEGGSATPVEIPVRQGGILTGRVYDQETGEGIGGIEMYVAYKGEIVTDPLGNFIATGLPPASIYVQVGESPGYSADDQTRRREIMMPAGGEMQVDFALRKGVPVAGVVTDAKGDPVVGARVSIQGGSSNWWYASAKTGPGGQFLCQEALPGKVSVEASKDNLYSRRKMDVVIEEAGLEGLNLVLDLVADAGMKGRISTANRTLSEANTNMEISLNPVDPSLPRRNGRVDLIGRFNITEIVPGEYDVMIETRSGMYSQCMAERLMLKPGELIEGLELGCKDQGTLTIAGRVLDSNRQPIEGARIEAPQAPMGQATTGPDGRFTLRGLHEGEFGLNVMHENYGTQSFNDLEAGAQDLEIVLQRRSTVSGRVIDAQTRQPIPAFEVAWSQGMTDRIDFWPGTAKPVSNVKGEYSLDKVEPDGTIAVYARASGYATGRASVEVPADATVNGVEIALDRGVKVRGTVVNAEGAPVSAVKIFLDNKPMQPEYESPATMTDVNGQFLLENLPRESVTLTAWAPEYAMASAEAPAGGGDVSILLGRGGSIEGRVFVDGAPASWYSVTLKDDSDHDQYVQLGDLQAGLDGTFKVEHLPPGGLVVAVALMQPMEEQPNSYAHIRTQVVPVAVENDRVTPVEVHFSSGRGSIHGRVMLDGVPASGFAVRLIMQTASGEAIFNGMELTNGYFTLPDLPLGTGEVIVTLFDVPLERRTEVAIGDGGDNQMYVSFSLAELNQTPVAADNSGMLTGIE